MQVHAELTLEVPVEHGLLLENLLDLAHAPFTHTTTFAKGWPVPDVVKFNAAKLLGGNWEPYPIDMAFEPPCMVLSTIGAAPAGLQDPLRPPLSARGLDVSQIICIQRIDCVGIAAVQHMPLLCCAKLQVPCEGLLK